MKQLDKERLYSIARPQTWKSGLRNYDVHGRNINKLLSVGLGQKSLKATTVKRRCVTPTIPTSLGKSLPL